MQPCLVGSHCGEMDASHSGIQMWCEAGTAIMQRQAGLHAGIAGCGRFCMFCEGMIATPWVACRRLCSSGLA